MTDRAMVVVESGNVSVVSGVVSVGEAHTILVKDGADEMEAATTLIQLILNPDFGVTKESVNVAELSREYKILSFNPDLGFVFSVGTAPLFG
jgi:hypothetical protein